MPITVAFVAAVGRNSVGDWTARPKIETIVAKHGGKMIGGIGSSTQPLTASFGAKDEAVKAAQEAWYLDDVEFAKVLEADSIATANVQENQQVATPDTKPVAADVMIGAVAEGKVTACDAVDILLGKKPYTTPTCGGQIDPNGDPKPAVANGGDVNPATATA